MGTPTLTLVNGENQERIANYLCERGAAQSLGRADRLDLDQFAAALKCMIENQVLRTTLSRAGRRLIDGRGAGRVVVMLREAA